jgi:hypothetical protein
VKIKKIEKQKQIKNELIDTVIAAINTCQNKSEPEPREPFKQPLAKGWQTVLLKAIKILFGQRTPKLNTHDLNASKPQNKLLYSAYKSFIHLSFVTLDR